MVREFYELTCGRSVLLGEGAFQAQYMRVAIGKGRETSSSPSKTLSTPGTCAWAAQQGGYSLWMRQAAGPHGAELAL